MRWDAKEEFASVIFKFIDQLQGDRLYDFLELVVQLDNGKELSEIDESLVVVFEKPFLLEPKDVTYEVPAELSRFAYISKEFPVTLKVFSNPYHVNRFEFRLVPRSNKPLLLGKDPIVFDFVETKGYGNFEGECVLVRTMHTMFDVKTGAFSLESAGQLVEHFLVDPFTDNIRKLFTQNVAKALTGNTAQSTDIIFWRGFVDAVKVGAGAEEICKASKLSDLAPNRTPEELLQVVRTELFNILALPNTRYSDVCPQVFLCNSSAFLAVIFSNHNWNQVWLSSSTLRTQLRSSFKRFLNSIKAVGVLSGVMGTIRGDRNYDKRGGQYVENNLHGSTAGADSRDAL